MSRWWPLIGVVVFFGVGIVLRCVLHRRRYGTWGVLLFRVRKGSQLVRDSLGIVVALVMFAEALTVAFRPGVLERSYVFRLPAWLGGLVMFAGVAMMFLAQGHLGASWRIGIDEGAHPRLVTGGLYRLCRNPIFSAMLITLAGFTLLVPTVASIVMFVGAAVGIRRQIGVEERYLAQLHGEAYRQYARHVGRFVPGLGRLR